MKLIKSLSPILILIAATFYFNQWQHAIPVAVLDGLVFLPLALAVLVIGFAIHFNRSTVFFYALVIIIANWLPASGWLTSELQLTLLNVLIPLQLLIFSLLRERGIFSVNAAPAYLSLFAGIVLAIALSTSSSGWPDYLLQSDWMPHRYFDWTPLSQTVLIVDIIAFISLLLLCFMRPSPQLSAGLGVLIILILQAHSGHQSGGFNLYSSVALLMCLYAVTQESWRMAYLDELTGIPARRALREKFQQLSGLYTVAMLDVDHFKKFNDSYGHDTGDSVLQMIAAKVSAVSGSGLGYRYGGEEFAIVFKGLSIDQASQHLELLRENIATAGFVINRSSRRKSDKRAKVDKNKTVVVTVSIGMADSNEAATTPWDALKLADKALYRAKDKGRNCVCS
ncbi:MAG: diguanylate cyclase (GGDEF)-like protein [Planctomycetota bacterium]|jgi:diguanylate cyclase (GGDEF)-like protein